MVHDDGDDDDDDEYDDDGGGDAGGDGDAHDDDHSDDPAEDGKGGDHGSDDVEEAGDEQAAGGQEDGEDEGAREEDEDEKEADKEESRRRASPRITFCDHLCAQSEIQAQARRSVLRRGLPARTTIAPEAAPSALYDGRRPMTNECRLHSFFYSERARSVSGRDDSPLRCAPEAAEARRSSVVSPSGRWRKIQSASRQLSGDVAPFSRRALQYSQLRELSVRANWQCQK